MYDIKPIEEEWEKYKKYKNRPFYYGFFGFFLVIFFGFFLMGNVKNDTGILFKYFDTFFNDKRENKIQFKKTSTLINGSLHLLETVNSSNINAVIDEPLTTFVDIPILDMTDSESTVSKLDIDTSRKKIHLDIIKTTSVTAYKDVEKRFYQSHDIDDALFLAKSYYEKNNYKKSEYWALQTNKLDSNLEESFFIFVKSKMKLGQKNEAINMLMAYLKKTNSEEGENLLYRINNNKF